MFQSKNKWIHCPNVFINPQFKMVNVKEAEILLQDTIEDTEQKIHISDSNIKTSKDQLLDSLEEREQEADKYLLSKTPLPTENAAPGFRDDQSLL